MAGERPQSQGRVKRHSACATTLFVALITSLSVLLAPSAGAVPGHELPSGQLLGPGSPRLNSPSQAEDEPSSENGAIIPGHYIVVLEDSVAHPGALAEAQTGQHDGELGFVYRYGMKGYSAELSHQAVEELRENPKVKYVTPDRVVTTQSQAIPTGIKRAYGTQNPTAEIDGVDKRVNADVAVIDTGIDYEHPDLNVYKRTNCVPADETPEGSEASIEKCVDNAGADGDGHGTHVAGTIGALDNGEGVVGMAPGARLWAVRVLNNKGSGSLSWIVAGVNWVTAHAGEIEVANMSIGCSCSAPALETAIDGSVEAGVVYVVAAGNDSHNASANSPAKNPNAITVSAIADYDGKPGGEGSSTCADWGEDDHLASFSNYGKGVDVAAPGVCIESTWPGGGYETISGTSMASPHVAGAAALLAAQSNPSSKEDVEAIRNRIVEEGNYEWTDDSGDGVKEPLLDAGEWTAITDGFDLITGSKPEATLHGRVNPRGAETTYRFEYDTAPYEAGKEGHGTSIPVPDAAAGSGSKYVPVSKTLTGLSNRMTYHYRLVASNSKGTFYGADREFATTPPTPHSGEADEIDANYATLHGVVNPEGAETTFRFEFGISASYGRTATASTDSGSESSASGTEDVDVSALVGGLAPNRTYHLRLLAENLAGTSYGEDQTFTTGPSEWVAQPTPVPDGKENLLSDVSCVSRSSCMAVGYDSENFTKGLPAEGLSARWDGEEWSLEAMPGVEGEETYPEHVSCASERWCAAVGSTFKASSGLTALAERWNGREWTVDSLPLATGTIESELADVSCASASACTAVGHYEKEDGKKFLLAERWNGTQWTRQTPLALGHEHLFEALQSVSCVDASYCVVGGWYEDSLKVGGGAELWTNTGWMKITGLSESLLWHVSCPLRNACTVVGLMPGNHMEAVHWDGKGWSAPESIPLAPGTSDTSLWDMACPEADSCTLTGKSEEGNHHYGVPFVTHWDGSKWSIQSTAEPTQEEGLSRIGAGLGGVSCPSPSWCMAAGSYLSQSFEDISGMVETYQAPGPVSLTELATHTGSSRTTLNASVDPQGLETTYRFEYGEDKSYGSELPASPKAIGSGEEEVEVAEVLKGLSPQSTYHFRIAATNSEGATYGEDRSFTTLAVAPAFSLSVGKSGSGEGQLSEPRGIALDGKDQIWVADSANSRISKFDQAGKPLASYGAQGSALGQFGSSSPGAIAVGPEGSVWAADTSNNRLQKLDSEGKFLKAIGWGVKDGKSEFQLCESSCSAGIAGSGQGQLDHPQGIALDAKGNVWVADSANNRLQELSPAGEYMGQVKTTGSATDLAFDAEGSIWVAEPSRNRIARYSPGGELLSEAGSEGTGNGQLKSPSGLGVEEGNVWVADSENNRVQVLNPKGEYLAGFGAAGSGEGQLSYPRDVAFDSEGNAWVSDSHNSRIQKWIYPEPPKAITEAATEVKRTSATLHGTLNPEAAATSYWFEYGKTSSYGSKAPTTPASVPPGSSNVAVSQAPTGLSEGTTYHFRLVASNAGGTAYGEDETLRTLALPIPKAITEAASAVEATQATLKGTVNPEGSATSYYFEYGTTTSYGTKIPTSAKEAGSGTSNVAVSQALTGLKAGTTYHFRLVAKSAVGTAKGGDKTLTTLKPPKATTEAATSIGETQATLNGSVNPEGSAPTVYFEYDTSEYKEGEGSHGTKTKGKTVSGTSNVAVSQALTGLKAGTTYHFRVMAQGAGVTVSGGDKTFKTPGEVTMATQLANMAVTEAFDGSSASLERFGAKWSALGWASGSTPKGSDTTTGWKPASPGTTVNGAFYEPSLGGTGSGIGAVATLAAPAGTTERYISLWLDMPTPTGTMAGYQLRFAWVSTNTYNVILSKWVGGIETELASKASYSFPVGSSFAIVDLGSTVSAWTNTGSGFAQLLSASDGTFESGKPGLGGNGTSTRLTNFKAGMLKTPPETTITASSTGTVTPDVSFSFTSSESGSSFECSLDADAYSACTSPKSYQGLTEGSHTFRVRAVGAEGTDPTPAERSFNVIETGKAVAGVGVLDDLQRLEVPLETGEWSQTSWVGEIGGVWNGNWNGYGVSNTNLAGAYWNPTSFSDAKNGILVAATLGTGPTGAGEYLSLWLDMPNPSSAKSGYEVRFTGTGSESGYKVELSKWVSGVRTVLANEEGFSLPVDTTMALTETGGALTLWTGTSSFSPVLSATDSTYSSGYAGLEANEGEGTEYDFRAGEVG